MAYLLLHNIFLGYKDSWEEEDNGGSNIAAVNQDSVSDATGFYLRLRMQDYLLTWYYNRLQKTVVTSERVVSKRQLRR